MNNLNLVNNNYPTKFITLVDLNLNKIITFPDLDYNIKNIFENICR